jgi:uncharacterized protein YjiS (DUF1127 family)
MTHLHSFTLSTEAHEVIASWGRGLRSGTVSNAVVMYDEMRKREREDAAEIVKLQSRMRMMERNIMKLQGMLTEAYERLADIGEPMRDDLEENL